ncbi:MAG: DUF3179 domain-containing protein [Caldithrix sp.]|nr:DUF3179 domain-containing protein [Caldithrix sp.]
MFRYGLFLLILSLFISCQEESNPSSSIGGNDDDWLIPTNQIYDGGPGQDGIPSIDDPSFVGVGNTTFLTNDELVVIYKEGDKVRAYPHAILNWHEIVNDDVLSEEICVSYCPLTGSTVGFDRNLSSESAAGETTYGVSGLLYNNNLILYDRLTESYWSQMLMKSVHGEFLGEDAKIVPLIETTFATLKKLYPGVEILSNQTGIYSSSQYQTYPYGDYKTNNNRLLFPVTNDDQRLPRKDRVLGVVTDQGSKAYTFDDFQNSINVINDQIDGVPVVIAGSRSMNFMVAYIRQDADGNAIELQATDAQLPAVMEDAGGNVYDIFGNIIDGPDQGRSLQNTKSFMAFWFAWGAFYPDIEIH